MYSFNFIDFEMVYIWAFEHSLISKCDVGKSSTMFPRILQWIDMKVAEEKISIALNNNKV